jgi:hypothetical protein
VCDCVLWEDAWGVRSYDGGTESFITTKGPNKRAWAVPYMSTPDPSHTLHLSCGVDVAKDAGRLPSNALPRSPTSRTAAGSP